MCAFMYRAGGGSVYFMLELFSSIIFIVIKNVVSYSIDCHYFHQSFPYSGENGFFGNNAILSSTGCNVYIQDATLCGKKYYGLDISLILRFKYHYKV